MSLLSPVVTAPLQRGTDIEGTAAGLAALGVEFRRYDGMDQDEHGIWTTPGGEKVAWFTDPDGNTLSLTQFDPAPASRVP